MFLGESVARGPARGAAAGNRPGRVEFGILADSTGRPLGVRMLPAGAVAPSEFAAEVQRIQAGLGLEKITIVGDRSIVTPGRLAGLRGRRGVGWIVASPSRGCTEAPDTRDVAELLPGDAAEPAETAHPAYPGERLIFSRSANHQSRNASPTEIVVFHTSLPWAELDGMGIVNAYHLAETAGDFFGFGNEWGKSTRFSDRVDGYMGARLLVSGLAAYVGWYIMNKTRILSINYINRSDEGEPALGSATGATSWPTHWDGVGRAGRVRRLQALFAHLATLTRNEVQIRDQTVQLLTTPTEVQQRIFQQLGVQVPLTLV
jgi:hypothetical protein